MGELFLLVEKDGLDLWVLFGLFRLVKLALLSCFSRFGPLELEVADERLDVHAFFFEPALAEGGLLPGVGLFDEPIADYL